jgi:hypothetical protein
LTGGAYTGGHSQPEILCKHRFHSEQLWSNGWRCKNGFDISHSNFMLIEMNVDVPTSYIAAYKKLPELMPNPFIVITP